MFMSARGEPSLSSSVAKSSPSRLAHLPFAQQQQTRSMTEACWRRRRRLWAYLADQGWNLQPLSGPSGSSTRIFRPSQPAMDPEHLHRQIAAGAAEDTEQVLWCGDRVNVAVSTSPSFDYTIISRSRKTASEKRKAKRDANHGKRASTAIPACQMMTRFEELTLRSGKPREGVQPSRILNNPSRSANLALRAANPSHRPLGLAMEGAGIVASSKVPHSAQTRTTMCYSHRSSEEEYAVNQRTSYSGSASTTMAKHTKGLRHNHNSHRPASFVNLNLDMRRDRAPSDGDDGCSCVSDDDSVSLACKRGAGGVNEALAWNHAPGSFPRMASSASRVPCSTAAASVPLLPGGASSFKLDRFNHDKFFGSTEPTPSQRLPRTLQQGYNPKPVLANWPRADRQPELPHNRKSVHVGQLSRRRTSNYDRRGQPIITLVSLTSASPEPVDKPDKELT